MKYRFILLMVMFVLVGGCAVRKGVFYVAFGCERPSGLTVLNEEVETAFNSNQIMFFGKYSGTKEAFVALADRLDLKKGAVSALPGSSHLKWWTPPSGDAQFSIPDRYYYYDPGNPPDHPPQLIVALYTDGVIYLYKNALPGKTGGGPNH